MASATESVFVPAVISHQILYKEHLLSSRPLDRGQLLIQLLFLRIQNMIRLLSFRRPLSLQS